MQGWVRFEDIRAGGYDPAARLAEMDRDGVDAEVLYPTPRLSQGDLRQPRRRAPRRHASQAYNDWLSEYVAHAPDRFGGLALLPEPRRRAPRSRRSTASLGRPGIRGVRDRRATRTARSSPTPEDDKVWARLVERGMPLSIHVSLAQAMPAAHRRSCPATAASTTRRTA